jgi:hypothetical protein
MKICNALEMVHHGAGTWTDANFFLLTISAKLDLMFSGTLRPTEISGIIDSHYFLFRVKSSPMYDLYPMGKCMEL